MLATILAQAPDFNEIEGAFGNEYSFRNVSNLSALFNRGITNIIFFAAGAAFLVYLISAGISMMTSRGDPKALESAKARLTQALIGFIIIFTAYWIVQIVALLLGLDGFGGIFGGGGAVGDGSCAMQCPVNTVCQNGACVIDPN